MVERDTPNTTCQTSNEDSYCVVAEVQNVLENKHHVIGFTDNLVMNDCISGYREASGMPVVLC